MHLIRNKNKKMCYNVINVHRCSTKLICSSQTRTQKNRKGVFSNGKKIKEGQEGREEVQEDQEGG
jgi:hypothetical protein